MRTALYPIAATLCAAAIALPVWAQPRPEPPRPRPAPPAGERPMPGHPLPPANALAAHDAAIRKETAEQVRARMQQHEDQERAKREAERKNEAQWKADRARRADEWRNDMASQWGNTLDMPEARTELSTHSDRMARLNRILDIAQDKKDNALAAHARLVIQKEIARDARVMAAFRDREGGR
ncbi:MAG TPA: hypothetical protein VMI54_11890 [Polyangiaceae bacterium]|nr:hypothetical protein [Polyangiaceae bacterium]